MFSKLFAFGPFFAKIEARAAHDVEAIIADFTNTVTKLEDAAVAKAKAAEKHAEDAVTHNAIADVLRADATRAQDVASKIRALVS